MVPLPMLASQSSPADTVSAPRPIRNMARHAMGVPFRRGGLRKRGHTPRFTDLLALDSRLTSSFSLLTWLSCRFLCFMRA